MVQILWFIVVLVLIVWLIELLFSLVGLGGFAHTLLLIALIVAALAYLSGRRPKV